jgi:hypothetical protein
MERMARNLLSVIRPDAAKAGRLRGQWVEAFRAEGDPMARMELLTAMSRLDESETIQSMLKLLPGETDARVREQIIVLAGFMRSAQDCIAAVCDSFGSEFERSDSARARRRVIEVASNIPAQETLSLIETLSSPAAEPDLRFACDEAILRLSRSMTVKPALLADVVNDLKRLAESDEEAVRSHAVHVLASPGMDQRAFLTERIASEPSKTIRAFLTKVTTQPTQ